MDVLPYPVRQKEQPVKTLKILVADGSALSDTQWEFIRFEEIQSNPWQPPGYASEPYIIYFKNDFTVEFPYHCRIPWGEYIAGNDGSFCIDYFHMDDTVCGRSDDNPFYNFEVNVMINIGPANRYVINDDILTFYREDERWDFKNRIHFKKITGKITESK